MMLEWNKNYLTGVTEFDAAHQSVFAMAQKIKNYIDTHDNNEATYLFVIREGSVFLRNYLKTHIVREEAYMQQSAYRGYGLHKHLHDEFYGKLMEYCESISEDSIFTREDMMRFVGGTFGWILEHIATVDLAMVGKGDLASSQVAINQRNFIRELNHLFAATLNIEANTEIISTNYAGEYFGEAVYQKLIYQRDECETAMIIGIERDFLLRVGKMIYGDDSEDEMGLLLSTLQAFGANFWRTLGYRFLENEQTIQCKESCFLNKKQFIKELNAINPTVSLLLTSSHGKFSVSSNTPVVNRT